MLRSIKLYPGKVWKITRDKRRAGEDKNWYGYCDDKKKMIYLNPELKGIKLLDTAIHEALHAQLEWLDEDVVRSVSDSLTRLVSLFTALRCIGSFSLASCPAPQFVKTFRTKLTRDLSWSFLALWMLGDMCMFAYFVYDGFSSGGHKYDLYFNYGFNGVICGYLLWAKWNYS
jgi:hypothetical protein